MPERQRGLLGKIIERPIFHPFRVEKRELGQRASFEEVAVQATFDKNRAIDPNVLEIELNELVTLANQLAEQTIVDERHRESSAMIRIRKKLYRKPNLYTRKPLRVDSESAANFLYILSSAPVAFDDESSTQSPAARNFPGDRLVSLLHSHPMEIPPSPTDLERLFLGKRNELRETCVFVSTVDVTTQKPGVKYLVFRGENTPQLRWRKVRNLFDTYFGKVDKAKIKGETARERDEDRLRIQRQRELQEVDIMEFAQKYDLKVFKAKQGENVAIRQELVSNGSAEITSDNNVSMY